MARPKKDTTTETVNNTTYIEIQETKSVSPHSAEWTDYVLSLLGEDEKINGNPTTDGLRRIFETVLDCTTVGVALIIVQSSTVSKMRLNPSVVGLRRIFETVLDCTIISATPTVVQSPDLANERRATVVYTMDYVLNNESVPDVLKYRSVSAAADVYWGNCDKIFRNHPVAVAETRAEGRALRKGLKLRKVVTADEIAKEVIDHDQDNTNTINHSQLNFFDVFGKRLNINIKKLLDHLAINSTNIYNISYDDAVKTITTLSGYQQNNAVPQELLGYDPNWK